jgi:hypothetical protein
MTSNNGEQNEGKSRRTWTEDVEIAANELVDRVKELIKEGNVRRLIIKSSNDNVLLEVPLTAGVAVGTAATIINPVIAALGAFAALLVRVKIEIVRVDDGGDGNKGNPSS